jgi:transcriptional regulator with XRE-family HTH domain
MEAAELAMATLCKDYLHDASVLAGKKRLLAAQTFLLSLAGMSECTRDPYKIEVGNRLRLTARELGYVTQDELAAYLGTTRAVVEAWYNGRALPPVRYMKTLCERRGVTLEWIYRGSLIGLPRGMDIRLEALTLGDDPPAVPPEPAQSAAPAGAAPPSAAAPAPAGHRGNRRKKPANGMTAPS